jgi:hypothetical protein
VERVVEDGLHVTRGIPTTEELHASYSWNHHDPTPPIIALMIPQLQRYLTAAHSPLSNWTITPLVTPSPPQAYYDGEERVSVSVVPYYYQLTWKGAIGTYNLLFAPYRQ